MLFKGTTTRSAEDIAQQIDSIGGQLDAFTVEGIRRLLHQGPRRASAAGDRPPDRPGLAAGVSPDDIEREKKVVLEEIKMVEDTPDDLVHEIFAEHFWRGHPLGPPDSGHARDGRR